MGRPDLKDVVNIFKQEGIIKLTGKSFRYSFREVFCWPLHLLRMRKMKKVSELNRWLDFVFNKNFSNTIQPIQNRAEIRQLLEKLQDLKPKYFLEIGTANGGSLFLFSRVITEDATLISVDLPGGKFGGGYSKFRIPLYKSFAKREQKLHLIRRNSQQTATVDIVKKKLKGRQLDVLYIDGDHTYGGVKKDFELYSLLVKKGGYIVFHDITDHQAAPDGCQVDKFWNEVKKNYEYAEYIDQEHNNWAGIGILKYV